MSDLISTSGEPGSQAHAAVRTSREASSSLTNFRRQRMIGKLQRKESATPKLQHLGRLGKNADHRCSIRASDFFDEPSRDHARHHLIEHHDELTDLELSGDFHGNGCSLKLLSIGPKQDYEDIGDGNAEKRFFVQPRMGVDEQIVEHELVDQILETVVHEAPVVPLTHPPGY